MKMRTNKRKMKHRKPEPTTREPGVVEFRANGQRWGGEIYFGIDVSCELEAGSRDVLEEGELAYWPPGQAFCIFFGATPASSGNEIRAASAVNILGKLKGDLSGLWEAADGAEVVIEKCP